MEIQGKIIAALEPRSGESKRNPGEKWMSQDFVLQQHDQFQRKLAFTVWGADRLQRFNIQVGQEVSVMFDIDAREWNGRWYTDIRAYDVRPVDPAATGATGAAPFAQANAPFPPAPDAPATSSFGAVGGAQQSEDDLPF